MTRLFGRGQLKVALLQVAAELDGANGYAIMQALDERVGGGWRPSPGAIYPALLALEDAGFLDGVERDGGRVYRVTPAGHRNLADGPDAVGVAAGRARSDPDVFTTVGAVLDRVAAAAPRRQRPLDAAAARRLEHRLRAGLRSTLANALDDADADPTKETLDG